MTAPSRLRSSVPSGMQHLAPERARRSRRAPAARAPRPRAPPDRRRRLRAPSSASVRAAVDLPLAMPPVSPITAHARRDTNKQRHEGARSRVPASSATDRRPAPAGPSRDRPRSPSPAVRTSASRRSCRRSCSGGAWCAFPSTPGRTRLINFFRVVVAPEGGRGPADKRELRFVDLPGFGYAKVVQGRAREVAAVRRAVPGRARVAQGAGAARRSRAATPARRDRDREIRGDARRVRDRSDDQGRQAGQARAQARRCKSSQRRSACRVVAVSATDGRRHRRAVASPRRCHSRRASASDDRARDAKRGLRVVVAALAVNIAIALFKFVAAGLSRSSAMLAEACHSLADTANQIFLLIGMRTSARPPDREHPFGYGPETYFWAFMVALCIFAVGGGFSVHEGIEKICASPRSGRSSSAIRAGPTSCSAFRSCSRATRSSVGDARVPPHPRAAAACAARCKETRDPTVLTVLFEDLAALFGLVVALAGILLTRLHRQRRCGTAPASIVVGLALGAVALRAGARRQEPAHRPERRRSRRGQDSRRSSTRQPRRRRAGAPAHHAPRRPRR